MSTDLRSAGILERIHIVRQNLGLDTCVVVAAKLVSLTEGETVRLSPENVYPALTYTIQQHAALSAKLSSDATSSVYKRISIVDVEKPVKFMSKEDGDLNSDIPALIEREFSNPIDTNDSLLWRLTVTTDNIVVFAWHHGMGDGQSGLAFLRTFVEGLNKEDHSFFTVVQTPDYQLTPPIEDLADLSLSFSTILSAVLHTFFPMFFKRNDVWTGHLVSTKRRVFKTRTRTISISSFDASKLRELTKANKTTVTAVLHVLCVCALSNVVLSNPSNHGYKRLTTSVPISLRTLANIPPTSMGDFVTSYVSTHKLNNKFSWEDVSAFKQSLNKQIPKSPQRIGLLKLLRGQHVKYLESKLGQKRDFSLELSNLGVFKSEFELCPSSDAKDKGWSIEDVYFSQDDGTLGAALKVNVVGCPKESVNINVSWGENAVSDADAKAFVEEFENRLSELLSS